ncbi:MAG: hypothetical protein Q7S40_21495 [Opitutaceae bacterium]|nr:hypothetical protein [Opitutaceae bacterium]
MNNKNQKTAVGLALVSALLAGLLHGQQTPTSLADGTGSIEPPVRLSPFEVRVEQDKGYQAADTLISGRIAMDLFKSPVDTTVLTREFLDDVIAFDAAEAAGRWLTSVSLYNDQSSESTDTRDFGARISFRGLSRSTNTRNYFVYGTTPESYLIERVEGARGSNSIIYGDAGAGGMLNYVTKRASAGRNFGNLNFRTDSHGTAYVALDLNRRLNDQLGLRINTMWQNRQDWRPGWFDRRKGLAIAGLYQPWKGMDIRAEVERGSNQRQLGAYIYTDQASSWNRTTLLTTPLNPTAPGNAVPAGAGLATLSGTRSVPGVGTVRNDYLLVSSAWDNTIMNWGAMSMSSGTGLLIEAHDPAGGPGLLGRANPLPSRDFRDIGPDSYQIDTLANYTLTLEQKLPGDGVVEIAAASFNVDRESGNGVSNRVIRIDTNAVLPDGRPNPKAGKAYTEGPFLGNYTPDYFDTARIAAAYPVLKLKNFKQTVSVVGQWRKTEQRYFQDILGRIDPGNPRVDTNINHASNSIKFRRYVDDPATVNVFPTVDGRLGDRLQNDDYFSNPPWFALPRVPGSPYQLARAINRAEIKVSKLNSQQINTIGDYFDGRVNMVAGIRKDKMKWTGNAPALFGNVPLNGLDPSVPDNIGAYNRLHESTSKSVGVTVFPTRWLGAYGFYGQAFRPSGDERLWLGTPSFVTPSTTRAAGLKFNLFGGMIIGKAGGYRTEETDRVVNWSNGVTIINRLWHAIGRDEMQLVAPNTFINDRADFEGKGWEAELTANMTNAFRMSFNIAFPEAKQGESYLDIKAYLDANRATWQQGRARITDPALVTEFDNSLRDYDNFLSGRVIGRTANGTPKYTANFFGNYTFQSGPVKGLRIGGGANFYGHRLIGNLGNTTADAFRYVYAAEYYLVTAQLGYNFRLGERIPVQLLLNVNNLLDHDDPIYYGLSTFSGVQYKNGYSYSAPRSATLSATFKF